MRMQKGAENRNALLQDDEESNPSPDPANMLWLTNMALLRSGWKRRARQRYCRNTCGYTHTQTFKRRLKISSFRNTYAESLELCMPSRARPRL